MNRKSIAFCCILSLLVHSMVACDDDDETDAEDGPHPIWGDWSPDEDHQALQGEWVTRTDDGEIERRYVFDGDRIVIDDGDGEPVESEFEIPNPGRLSYTIDQNGREMELGRVFAREGDDIFMYGIPAAAGAVLDDRVVLYHNTDLVLFRDDQCTYHESEGLTGAEFDEEGQEIDCGIEEADGEEYFVYTHPGGQEITTRQQFRIGEESITNRAMRQHRLEPVE